jgi:tRNA-dihydrouridine synthase A
MMMYADALKNRTKLFAVAPMIDWSDRHCRYLHRQLSKRAIVFTEMVVADAILHGPKDKLLGHHVEEHPVTLQLGGSSPEKLSRSIEIAQNYHYDEFNLNVGCPSDRVQSGAFGACLMKEPDLVADCIRAMKAVSTVPVTVKCRIGVDDQEPTDVLPDFIKRMIGAGADAIWIHARKAWLQGLSPKENRDIPPLDYELVYQMKRENPDLFVGINGGIADIDAALAHLEIMDGVMLGRAAYHNTNILADVADYIANGGKLGHVTRHMVGLFQGYAGARRFRQILSSDATKPGAGPEVIEAAFAQIDFDVPVKISA